MKFTDEVVRALCARQLTEFQRLVDEANLNGSTASAILGVSRSRYQQITKSPDDTPMLQAHIFLNLLWANTAIEHGLEEGFLPAAGFKGAAQEHALAHLQESAS